MISAKSRYETHDGQFLTIVNAFKTWRHYLEGFHYEVLLLTNFNNLCRFIDIKSLSSRQVYWAQKIFWYYFQIDYCQGKVNEATNILSQYCQQSANGKKNSLSRKHQKLVLPTFIFDQRQLFRSNVFRVKPVIDLPSLHLRDARFAVIEIVLGYATNQIE